MSGLGSGSGSGSESEFAESGQRVFTFVVVIAKFQFRLHAIMMRLQKFCDYMRLQYHIILKNLGKYVILQRIIPKFL